MRQKKPDRRPGIVKLAVVSKKGFVFFNGFDMKLINEGLDRNEHPFPQQADEHNRQHRHEPGGQSRGQKLAWTHSAAVLPARADERRQERRPAQPRKSPERVINLQSARPDRGKILDAVECERRQCPRRPPYEHVGGPQSLAYPILRHTQAGDQPERGCREA